MRIFSSDFTEWALVIIVLAFAAMILWKLRNADFAGLIQELEPGPDGKYKASLSRLQFLIFTFVIAGLYVTLCLQHGDLLSVDPGVLGLLGISGGGYVVSKSISKTKKDNGDGGDAG